MSQIMAKLFFYTEPIFELVGLVYIYYIYIGGTHRKLSIYLIF